MKLLILFHALIYQAFLCKGTEVVVASPEEIAKREPDGDHILQEESRSQAPQVLLPPDGEVTAAAVRRAEALRYPSRKPDKFRELMEETDIREIHRIIVPPLPNRNTSEVIENNTNNDANNPNVFVKVLNLNNQETQEFIKITLPKKEADAILQKPTQPNFQISSNPTDSTRGHQEDKNINTQLPSNREIKFDTKSERIDVETAIKPSNIHSVVSNKQSVQNVVLLRESDSVKNTLSSTDSEHSDLHKVIISNPSTQVPNDFENSDLETTTQVSDKIFSFLNQPIVVQDITIPEVIKKPSVDLEAPILIIKPSADLEAPLESTGQVTEILADTTKVEATTVSSSTPLTNEKIGNQNIAVQTTTVRGPTQGESNLKKISVLNRNSENIEGVLITSPGQPEHNVGTEKISAQTYQSQTPTQISLNFPKEITTVKNTQQTLEVSSLIKKIPSLELELPKLDDESEPNGRTGINGRIGSASNAPQTDLKGTLPLFEIREPEFAGIKKDSSDQRQSQSEIKAISSLNTPVQQEISITEIPSDTVFKNLRINDFPQRTTISFQSEDTKTKQKHFEDKEIHVGNVRETSEIPMEKRILSPDAINPPTLDQKGLHNVQATIPDQRQAILGNAINNNIVNPKDNANSQNYEKERIEALNFIKDHPLCEQALKYMELTRPQLLFQIYISMAPFYDGISKALHTEPGYALSYTNYSYYQHEPRVQDVRQYTTARHTPVIGGQLENGQLTQPENVRISRQNTENDSGDHPQHKKRCVKSVTQNRETMLENAMPIAEALYKRQNVLEEIRTV